MRVGTGASLPARRVRPATSRARRAARALRGDVATTLRSASWSEAASSDGPARTLRLRLFSFSRASRSATWPLARLPSWVRAAAAQPSGGGGAGREGAAMEAAAVEAEARVGEAMEAAVRVAVAMEAAAAVRVAAARGAGGRRRRGAARETRQEGGMGAFAVPCPVLCAGIFPFFSARRQICV